MKKYIWFFTGYFTALVTILVVSCSYSPLEANTSELGSNQFNPMFVKVVE